MTTPPSIEAIRKRASRFALEFADASYESGQAQSFIRGLCEIFELPHLRAVSFEHRVRKLDGRIGRIDGFFPGSLLIEMKSAGEDLEAAYHQATRYLPLLKTEELPRHILVSDFRNIHLYDRESHSEPIRFRLADLPRKVDALLFLAGHRAEIAAQQAKINSDAAEMLASLHDEMQANGYRGKDLERYLVRIVFCLFADDTALFGRLNQFHEYIQNQTRPDGSDLHQKLDALFEVLDTAPERRAPNLPQSLRDFPYVNGALFEGRLATYYFDQSARDLLLKCLGLEWSEISPEIFGSLFQAIMHFEGEGATARAKKRREFGAHYTSEINIKKSVDDLFVREFRRELNQLLALPRGKSRDAKLTEFQQRLSEFQILDPACGCGNFLVVAYREIRLLEMDVICALHEGDTLHLDIDVIVMCSVAQCHGIEIDKAACEIAMVALWLTDHQLNMRLGARLGTHYARLPLIDHANVVCANALQLDWASVIAPERCSAIVGNPPFVGAMLMSDAQRADMAEVFADLPAYGVLDYVAAWYWKAARYTKNAPNVSVAFVSTNSIVQGEQTALLWEPLLRNEGLHINFAHQTFRWSNEGRGVAAVHCVVIGFGRISARQKRIYVYATPTSIPDEHVARHINAYLVDAPDVFLRNRSHPLSKVPPLAFGNMPRDGGALLLSDEERSELLLSEPAAAELIRRFNSAKEFLNGIPRWCLWLKDLSPEAYRNLPKVRERIERVRDFRLASKAESTRRFAATPALFCQIAQPDSSYLLVPRHSSEQRSYIPLGFCGAEEIVADSCLFVREATSFHFGVLSSAMHMAWVRFTCGRIKSDFRYSKEIVYNNFPWPESNEDSLRLVSEAADGVLDVRRKFPEASLADLYDPLSMPAALVRAHLKLDAAVDQCYRACGGCRFYASDSERVAFLFGLYSTTIGELPLEVAPRKGATRRGAKSKSGDADSVLTRDTAARAR